MPKTLDLIRATAQTPVYDWLDFGEFHADLAGQGIRVRVNPPRATIDELVSAWEQQQAHPETAQVLDVYIRVAASLLTEDSESTKPLDASEFAAFINGAQGEADVTFRSWLLRAIYEKVTAHFLSMSASKA